MATEDLSMDEMQNQNEYRVQGRSEEASVESREFINV